MSIKTIIKATDWIQLLTDLSMLGQEELARLMDHSPDVASALLVARANAEATIEEAKALRAAGHEND